MRTLGVGIVWIVIFASCTSYPKPNPTDTETAKQVYQIRQGTDPYLNIERAKIDGYFKASGYIPHQGYQFLNPRFLTFFDLRRPPILLYDRNEEDGRWQLLGAMFVIPREQSPTRTFPFKWAEFLAHNAMCHYEDGTTLPAKRPEACPEQQTLTQAPLGTWHSDLWLVAAWTWSHNPNGLFALFNPILQSPRHP